MLVTAAISLVAGALSVLAPCVLPFLPVIVGGSLHGATRSRPWIIAGSLVVSLVAFTVLLKVTALSTHIAPRTWAIASGALVIALGLSMLVPGVWSWIAVRTRLDSASHGLLDRTMTGGRTPWRAVLTGAALGPVLTSCSPTYAWVIATVLPASPAEGILYLGLYCLGLAGALLAIGLLGRRLVSRLSWAADPRGWFQRGIAVLFVIVGVAVLTGQDKVAEGWIGDRVPAVTALEQHVLPAPPAPGGDGSRPEPAPGSGHPAPELRGITSWLNSDPLTLERLRGKVVLVDFWTYSCVNCKRTQPYLNSWYSTYHDKGLEIIGVHAPEFAFEKEPANVAAAVKDAGIVYPVALDDDFATWNAFGNRYWPAKYLIDRDGTIRYEHFGEGSYDETEDRIRGLLGEPGSRASATAAPPAGEHGTYPTTRETYLGLDRARGFRGSPSLASGPHGYTPVADLPGDSWTLGGRWDADGESVWSVADGATLDLRFSGREVNLVLEGPAGATVGVRLDGDTAPGGGDVHGTGVRLDGPRMYRLVSLPEPAAGARLHLTFPPGVRAHAFTFG